MVKIGIDVGGTGIKVGVVGNDYQIIRENSIPTCTDIPFEEQLKHMADLMESHSIYVMKYDDPEYPRGRRPGTADRR